MPRNNEIVLRPSLLNIINLGVAVFALFVVFVAGAILIREILIHSPETTYIAAAFLLSLLCFFGSWVSLGDTVIITDLGISKPIKFRIGKPKIIPYSGILWYMKYSPHTDKVDSVSIMTRENRIVIYHDILTPGCVNAIIENLQEHGIEERSPSTSREKYGR